MTLRAPFPWFGGKRDIADAVWRRFGRPVQYIEPFCGSAAVLLAAPAPASLEVIGDCNGFVANFWRAAVHQPDAVAHWADYPVSHIDLGARHGWLMEHRDELAAGLQDADWPGDAKVAGWWLWGQCCWIGSGWCEWSGQIPHASDAGRGIQAAGQIPHASSAGMGIQAAGQIPRTAEMGGILAPGRADRMGPVGYWTSGGRTAHVWLRQLADRLERVRSVHGDWTRCLNRHYGGTDTAIFFDPPYVDFEGLYRTAPVAQDVAAWCRVQEGIRIALCGHAGDYELPGWDVLRWTRKRHTYSGDATTDQEAIWFSPACLPDVAAQADLFGVAP